MKADNLKIGYHLKELAIALNPADSRHHLPTIFSADKTVLDIGCGIGQTLFACNPGAGGLLVGMDIDFESLAFGRGQFEGIVYLNGSADALPFAGDAFDLIISRVSLHHTNIPVTIKEMYRVARTGGRIWLSLQSIRFPIRYLLKGIENRKPGAALYHLYVILNGICFNQFQKVYRHPTRHKYESFQSGGGIKRMLAHAGFRGISVDFPEFIVTAYK